MRMSALFLPLTRLCGMSIAQVAHAEREVLEVDEDGDQGLGGHGLELLVVVQR
jgi:hypothetical protein